MHLLFYDCDGLCLVDSDGDGYVIELEIVGCTDINYHVIMMKLQQIMMAHVPMLKCIMTVMVFV